MSNWLQRYRGYILVILINLVILGGVIVLLQPRPEPSLIVSSPSPTPIPTPTPTPAPTPTPRPLRVYVSGAVTNPDVYELPAESIVKDAIEAAGGATSKNGLECINLALSVVDGQHIYVPKECEETPTMSPPTRPSVTPSVKTEGKININTASQSELETLPGIGPSRAQGIIENRPYGSIEEIKKVPGIGEATFQNIKNLITTD